MFVLVVIGEKMATTEIAPSNTFFLHPNENPSLVLVQLALDGTNYHSWNKSIKMTLISKNNYGFVDGTIQKPPSMLLLILQLLAYIVSTYLERFPIEVGKRPSKGLSLISIDLKSLHFGRKVKKSNS